MKIKTSRFGEVEVNKDLCFEMVIPILGYEDENEYVFIEHKEQSNFRWFQSTKTPELAFVTTIAGCFGIDYSFELPVESQNRLGIETVDDVLAFNIVAIPHENPREATINLVAPLIFNIRNHKGGQVILADATLKVNHPLIQKEAVC